MGDVRTQRRAPDFEAAILAALERPLSRRELWAQVGRVAISERVLKRLIESGAVVEIGTRRTFDNGVERLLKSVIVTRK